MNKLFSICIMVAILAACGSKKNNETANNTQDSNKTTTNNEANTKQSSTKVVAFTNIKPEAFKQLMGTKAGIVLDVRTQAEVDKGKLPKATNIDFYKPDFDDQVAKLDKSRPVYVYCAVGGRSGKAMKKMKAAGFKEVYNLDGGFGAWKQLGYTIEK
ncbi:rhodanese-like domain-containing protein [uncultured Microscilla sp.]|uniref:rhodanese-like domain-containing protein n=1 Tax=uncultured Microscilla sp. TaxID=432653 RepID=UPI002610266E|nr:rhodanese-like domain-containing protein [uncultured Microscilla sp.]